MEVEPSRVWKAVTKTFGKGISPCRRAINVKETVCVPPSCIRQYKFINLEKMIITCLCDEVSSLLSTN